MKPRIRTLKPEIWQSRDAIALSAVGKVAFVGMITLADDEGRLETDPQHLKDVVLHDNASLEEIQAQLELMTAKKMLVLYQVNDVPYAQLLNWNKHQKVDHPRPSALPPPPPNGTSRAASRSLANGRESSRSRGDRPDRIVSLPDRDRTGSRRGSSRPSDSKSALRARAS